MKFGSREIANVVFRAKSAQRIGNKVFAAGQPVLYIDTATTSTVEGSATSVYAQGGRGNTRLVTWEGEKTLTFTVEDALLSPVGMAILSGAGLWSYDQAADGESGKEVHVHTMTGAIIEAANETISSKTYAAKIDLTDALTTADGYVYQICAEAPIFVMKTEDDGSITGDLVEVGAFNTTGDQQFTTLYIEDGDLVGTPVMVDYYMLQPGESVQEIQIDAEKFAGYFYVEAETLFRRQSDGVDMPANLTFPNVKIQSNFSFSMSATGDPSTFTFTMDAMPGFTYFNKTKKVLCAIQVVNGKTAEERPETVFGHTKGESVSLGRVDDATGKAVYEEWTEENDSYKTNANSQQSTENNKKA